ncbi:MAG TPA: CHAT domain-containing tetratricopeptide repeat protein [Gemmatimonadales bacterium]
MISVAWSLFAAALAVQTPAADTLRREAVRLSETALVTETRARPLAVREAITRALADNELDAAHNLAAAYALAWTDSFLVREVARFAAWPPAARAAKVWDDSVRREGIAAYGRDGPRAAIAIWRRVLSRASSIPDTAGIASVLGNIGAAFLADGQQDSAETNLTHSQALATAIGDVRVQANDIVALAGLSEDRGDLAVARNGYTRALELQERIGDTRGMAAAYNNLGLLAQDVGDMDEARRQFEAALAINRRDGRDEVAATNQVNLAGLASLAGDFATAERRYRDALATWRLREQWADAASALHGLGQLELRRGDYPAAQQTLGQALAIYDRTGPPADDIAVRRELAGALSARGDLQGALDELRRAQRIADSTRGSLGVRAGLALARADYALQLNSLGDAERLYGRAEFLYRRAGDQGGEAEAQQGRGLLFLERDNYPRAQALFETALRTQSASGHARAAALTRVSLGVLSLQRGDTTAARRQLARAASDLDEVGDPVGAAAAIAERASLEAAAGRPGIAESLYHAGLDRLGNRVAPEVTWQLHAGLGLVLRGRGAMDDAARELRAALAEIDRPARSLVLAERRSAYLADKWDVYAQLALTERARGLPGAAFEASERLRAREMLELLARGRVESAGDTAGDLVEREQDLRRRIAELTSASPPDGYLSLRPPLLEVGLSPRPPLHDVERGSDEEGQVELRRAQDDYAELLLEMRERAPRHSDLVARGAASWRDVAPRLASDEAFIEYLVSDSGSLAFVVTRDTLAVVDLGIAGRDLAQLVKLARGALVPHPGGEGLWRGPLRRLHQYLIAPIEEAGLLSGKSRLVIVPQAELHYLPFAALVDSDGRFLVQRYDVALAPSASVWLALGERAPERAATGVLAFAPRTDALPASRREVAMIGRLAGAEVLTGTGATEAAFRRAAPERRVLHLATYGVLNKQNPLFSFVELAPGGDQDGRLEVHEVFGLHLSADLVVLSACQTGLASGALADVPPGDDWVGLTRAFLHAGAAHVVATLWPVDDWATALLMEGFYAGYLGDTDPAGALAAAQRALLAQPATSPPFYWAGFVAVGGASPGEHP